MSTNQLSLPVFRSMLRVLTSIDRHEVEDAFESDEEWVGFREHPWKWLIQTDDRKAGIFWKTIMKRNHVCMTEEKLVHCPACSGNGYIRNPPSDPQVTYLYNYVDQCELCDSKGEVPKHLADEWPFK